MFGVLFKIMSGYPNEKWIVLDSNSLVWALDFYTYMIYDFEAHPAFSSSAFITLLKETEIHK